MFPAGNPDGKAAFLCTQVAAGFITGKNRSKIKKPQEHIVSCGFRMLHIYLVGAAEKQANEHNYHQ